MTHHHLARAGTLRGRRGVCWYCDRPIIYIEGSAIRAPFWRATGPARPRPYSEEKPA